MARLFEFQSKKLLKQGGIPIPRGDETATPARPKINPLAVTAYGSVFAADCHLGVDAIADIPAKAREVLGA